MGDLKPIGSEKLTGQDKIKRIMEIARFNEVIPSNINESSRSEYSISLADGNKYEIVKERQGYVIKKTLSESESEYIEPMKNRKYYSSYSQAFKRLNLVAGELNRLTENEEEVSLFGEQKKFVLKTPQPKSEPTPISEIPSAPPAVPEPSLPPSPSEEVPGMDDSFDFTSDEEFDTPEGDEEFDTEIKSSEDNGEEHVTFKTIQKLTGKLTQKIRTLDNEEGMTSEDIKYVINMVLSSLNLKSLSEEDKEDIISKFDEDSEDLGGDDMDGEDFTDDSEVADIQSDMDVEVEEGLTHDDVHKINPDDFGFATHDDSFDGDDEEYNYEYMTKKPKKFGNGKIIDNIFKESKVDKVISKYFEVSKKEILENRDTQVKKKLANISEAKKQMKSVIKLTETIEQELAAQKFLEENSSAKIVGKTNKKNLVFENKGKEVKISPEGLLI